MTYFQYFMQAKLKRRYYKYLFEFLTIFIGITLSFVFEEFRVARQDSAVRKEMMKTLAFEMEAKKKELDTDEKLFEEIYQKIDSCILLSQTNQKLSNEQIRYLYFSLDNDHSFFDTRTPSYISLSTSGIWQTLPTSLQRGIYDVYNVDFRFLEVMYQTLTEYSSFIQQKHLVPLSLIYPIGKEPNYSLTNQVLSNNNEFRSAIILIRNQYKDIQTQLENTSIRLDSLAETIKKQ